MGVQNLGFQIEGKFIEAIEGVEDILQEVLEVAFGDVAGDGANAGTSELLRLGGAKNDVAEVTKGGVGEALIGDFEGEGGFANSGHADDFDDLLATAGEDVAEGLTFLLMSNVLGVVPLG